jgi:hypothetical protein
MIKRITVITVVWTALALITWYTVRTIRRRRARTETNRDAALARWATQNQCEHHPNPSPLALIGLKYFDALQISARPPHSQANLIFGTIDEHPYISIDYTAHHHRTPSTKRADPYQITLLVISTAIPMPAPVIVRPASANRRFQFRWGDQRPVVETLGHYEIRSDAPDFARQCAAAVAALPEPSDDLAYEFTGGHIAILPARHSLIEQAEQRANPEQLTTMRAHAIALARHLAEQRDAPPPAPDAWPIQGGIPPARPTA